MIGTLDHAKILNRQAPLVLGNVQIESNRYVSELAQCIHYMRWFTSACGKKVEF